MKPPGSEHQKKVEWFWSDFKNCQAFPDIKKKTQNSYSYLPTYTRIYLKEIPIETLFLKHDLIYIGW